MPDKTPTACGRQSTTTEAVRTPTPGPWVIATSRGECDLAEGLYVNTAEGLPLAFASSGNQADARLIAASPATLAVLKKLVNEIGRYHPEFDAHLFVEAERAIAVAEGTDASR